MWDLVFQELDSGLEHFSFAFDKRQIDNFSLKKNFYEKENIDFLFYCFLVLNTNSTQLLLNISSSLMLFVILKYIAVFNV